MKILNIQVLRGPNYWSNYRKKLIVLHLDLEEYEHLPTNILSGFNERLKELIPTLFDHRCSPGIKGGFFQRLEEGTWLGHVIEHIALELQSLAGMDCGFGRTYSTNKKGVYNVIFSYEIEEAGIYAAKAAVTIADCLANERKYQLLSNDLDELQRLFDEEQLGPSTGAIVKEAERRKIPFTRSKNSSLIILGQGVNQKKIWATVSSQTSSIGVDIAGDKEITKHILASSFIPVPRGLTLESLEDLEQALVQLSFPLVIKPLNGNHGRGITADINSKEKAILGFTLAQKISNKVLVEQFIQGNDYRFLVVNYKVVAVAKRTPAMVIGTGIHSIQQLIDETNSDPQRGMDHENVLTTIKIDEATLTILIEKNLSLHSILPKGSILYLKDTANLSSGGTATDVTDEVHPLNIILAERIARLINLDICGIDIIAEDVKTAINEKNGAVIEVNAGPGFRMHLYPTQGIARNVAAPVIDMLYPPGSSSKVPLIAVTGTNGKTTVVRLIAHLAKQVHQCVGFTTTDGIYIDGQLICPGDCSGPLSAAVVLCDPLVDFAVLECARGGILRSGLGFNECTISVITNITNDHLGLNEIDTLEELARVKAVVAHSTTKDGYAVLNAEDDLVYALKNDLSCNIALFSMQENSRINEHCHLGGLAAYIENDFIVIRKGNGKQFLAKISNIPLTHHGIAICMIKNILPAVLAGIISNLTIETIANALFSFKPSPENIPGRMNIFNFDDFQVIVDYAHNEGAYLELKNFVNKVKCKRKVGIIGATGNRRAEDIQLLGYHCAHIFDEIIIRHDKDGRGRTNQKLTELIMQGITSSKFNPKIKIISNEFEAVKYAMDNAIPDTLIFYSVDKVLEAVEYMKNEEQKFKLNNVIMSDH